MKSKGLFVRGNRHGQFEEKPGTTREKRINHSHYTHAAPGAGNDYRDEYVAFCVILVGCIDGLDSCFAGEEDNPQMRLRVIRALFAIYRFYTNSEMDLDEDIPGLLVGNTTPGERQVIAGWVCDALAEAKGAKWSSSSRQQRYSTFLLELEKDKKDHE